MKRLCFFVVTILSISVANLYGADGKLYTPDDLTVIEGLTYNKHSNTPLNGTLRVSYESGSLYMELPYLDGMEDGVAKEYYESGALKATIPFSRSEVNGIAKEYYSSGKLRKLLPIQDDVPNGSEKHYYESGELKQEVLYKMGRVVSGYNYERNGKRMAMPDSEIRSLN